MKKFSLIIALLLLGALLPSFILSPVNSSTEELFILINEERVERGVEPLALDIRLETAAQLHSEDMATHGFLSHIGSDGSTFVERAAAQGYIGASGEVIAFGYSDPVLLLDAWMSSPSHRDVILAPIHRHMGIGLDSYYWTVDFGACMYCLTQLTSNTASDRYPSICGDGSKIAFCSTATGFDDEIFVINSDGTGLTQLTNNTASDCYPSICGDGSKIAFVWYPGDDFEVSVVNSDSTGLTQLTTNTKYDGAPSICGDGSKIAFRSDVDGDAEIFVVNSDGSGLTPLTSNTAEDRNPSFCEDGSKIAFQSDVDGDDEIFVINSDGSGLTQLTNNTAADAFPSICGDGSKIAFQSYVDGDAEIFMVNSDGSGLTQLTSNTASDRYPSICGDGSKIAFQSDVDGDDEIFVINSDGSGLTQLTNNTASDQYPSIDSDGSKIAFQSDVDGDWEIFVVSLVGGFSWDLILDPGWNMVSFPCLPADATWDDVLGECGFHQVLTWDGTSYITPPNPEFGVGYWVLVLESCTVTITSGMPCESYERCLDPGWSMIGSIISCTVDADCVFPSFYQLLTWDGTSYVTSTTIEPGKGYWVLVLEETCIVVDSSCCI